MGAGGGVQAAGQAAVGKNAWMGAGRATVPQYLWATFPRRAGDLSPTLPMSQLCTPAAAELQPSDVVLDLYCGTGTIALALAGRCRAAYGVEVVAAAVRDARCVDNAGCRSHSSGWKAFAAVFAEGGGAVLGQLSTRRGYRARCNGGVCVFHACMTGSWHSHLHA